MKSGEAAHVAQPYRGKSAASATQTRAEYDAAQRETTNSNPNEFYAAYEGPVVKSGKAGSGWNSDNTTRTKFLATSTQNCDRLTNSTENSAHREGFGNLGCSDISTKVEGWTSHPAGVPPNWRGSVQPYKPTNRLNQGFLGSEFSSDVLSTERNSSGRGDNNRFVGNNSWDQSGWSRTASQSSAGANTFTQPIIKPQDSRLPFQRIKLSGKFLKK